MANEKKLDCVILGLLSHEDLTGYEIKKRMDSALSHFWGASYGSIYPTLKYLLEHGFAVNTADTAGGRSKLIYHITEQGHKHLADWLTLPAEKDEIRYETLLKLFFGKEAGPEQTLAHIREFRVKTESKMNYLLGARSVLEKNMESDQTHTYYLLTAEFGIQTYHAYLDWCTHAEKILTAQQNS